MTARRGPGQRAGLTHVAVLDAARALLAVGGVDAITMRALARRLAVAPNALYSHVASKTALLDELLDDVLASVHSPDPAAADPLAELADLMTSTYTALTAHPELVPIYLSRQGARGPNAVRLGTVMDELLARAGAGPAAVADARRALIIHTLGFAAFTTGAGADRPLGGDELAANYAHSLRWLLAGIADSHPERATRRGSDPRVGSLTPGHKGPGHGPTV